MLENIRTGFIENKLCKLGELARIKEGFEDCLLREFPQATKTIEEYHNTFFSYDFHLDNYEITLDNITYGFEEEKSDKSFTYIKVKDIVVYHNRKKTSCHGLFEDIECGWNHNSPVGLLEQIRKDSVVFKKAIKNISKKTNKGIKWMKEQDELNELFK